MYYLKGCKQASYRNVRAPHLFCAIAVIEQLNSAQLENLVQKGRRLVYVNRNGALAGWIPHSLIKVLQPGGRAIKYTHDVNHIGR